MPETGYTTQDNNSGSNASSDACYAKIENDFLRRLKLDEQKASGHQYTKSELKKLGKGTVVDIVLTKDGMLLRTMMRTSP